MQSDNDTGISRAGTSQGAMLDPHDVRDDLADLRCNLPFVPVIPFPAQSSIVKPAINTAIDIAIPDNAVLMKVEASASFFISKNGNANGQDMATSSANGNGPGSCDVHIASSSPWYYVYGKKSVSVFSLTAGNVIGAQFVMRDQI